MGKITYIKCPRCELNYIDSRQQYCDVCKAELGLKTKITLLDDYEDEEDSLVLCPICKTNYISLDEDMCDDCRALQVSPEEDAETTENDEEWRNYVDDEEDLDEPKDVPLDELKDIETEFGDDEEEEEEEPEVAHKNPDDEFEYVSLSDDDVGIDDDDDEEDEDEEDGDGAEKDDDEE